MTTWKYMKKLVIIGLISIVVFYSIVVTFWRDASLDYLEQPMYKLINPLYMNSNLNAVAFPDTGVVMHVPVLDLTNYVFLPSSFAVDTAYVNTLLSHSAYLAKLLTVAHVKALGSNATGSTENFSCRCGRVSDPCVCCGQLSAPRVGQKFARPGLSKPIILPSVSTATSDTKIEKTNDLSGEKSSPSLCVNITYRPKTGKIHLTATIVISDNPPHEKGESNIGGAEIKSAAASPNVNRVALLDSVLSSPLSNPTTTCAENSLMNAYVSICVNLTRLNYIYDPGTEHKTAFLGCGRVQIILQKQYIVADYGQFCFRAQRGAVDDADRAAAVANTNSKAPIVKEQENKLLPVVVKEVENSVKDSKDVHVAVHVAVPNAAAVQEAAVLPSPEDNVEKPAAKPLSLDNKVAVVAKANEVKKPIPGSFDHNDINRGVP